jgi:hypothetical protein
MKSVKNALIFTATLTSSMFFSSCDGVLFDDITYVDYPIYTVHHTPIHRSNPFHQVSPRFEPVQRMPHNSIPPRVQRSGPQGVVRSGRGFNRR